MSNSWGAMEAYDYDKTCYQVDKFVWENNDMTIVIAAGNDGEKGSAWQSRYHADSARWDPPRSPRTESASAPATATTWCARLRTESPTSPHAETRRACGSGTLRLSHAA